MACGTMLVGGSASSVLPLVLQKFRLGFPVFRESDVFAEAMKQGQLRDGQ